MMAATADLLSDPQATEADAPLRLPHTDWLHHRLTISGPDDALAALRASAAGAGVIPWQLDLDRMAEDWFHLLVAPPDGQPPGLGAAGARILAAQLREAVERRHQLALSQVGRSRACVFDLHALLPVPEAILRLGPDHPQALAWLWRHWGTTQPLRHVTEVPGQPRRRAAAAGQGAWRLRFWSADWTPWRALAGVTLRGAADIRRGVVTDTVASEAATTTAAQTDPVTSGAIHRVPPPV